MKYKLVFLILLGTFLAGSKTSAHTELQASNPTPGATLAKAPEQIRLMFSEPIEQAGIVLRKNDTTTDLNVVLSGDDMIVVGELESPITAGVFTVIWSATAKDKHMINGSYQFAYNPDESALSVSLMLGIIGTAATVVIVFWRYTIHRRNKTSSIGLE